MPDTTATQLNSSAVSMQASAPADTASRETILTTTQPSAASAETSPPATTTDGLGGWVAWGALAVALIACFLSHKVKSSMQKEVDDIKLCLAKKDKEMAEIQAQMDNFKYENAQQEQRLNEVTKCLGGMTAASTPYRDTKCVTTDRTAKPAKASMAVVRYANMQSPDENGVLRFSERSMTEANSAQKMFVLELDILTGVGTYRINPDATRMIMDDLQMFKDYVKPFTFSGKPAQATIKDLHLGKLTKQGTFWLVDTLLEVSIS